MAKTDTALFEFQGAPVRTVLRNGEPYWVAKDVCDILGYLNAGQVTRWLDADGYTALRFEDVFPGQETNALAASKRIVLISESGLYELIFRSARPEARAFRRWVTAEVLPTIRRTGGYLGPAVDLAHTLATDPDAALDWIENVNATARALRDKNLLLAARNQELAEEHVVLAPKAAAYDAWFDHSETCSVRDAARLLQSQFSLRETGLRDRLRRWRWTEKNTTAATAYAVACEYMINQPYLTEFGPRLTSGRLTAKGFRRIQNKLHADHAAADAATSMPD